MISRLVFVLLVTKTTLVLSADSSTTLVDFMTRLSGEFNNEAQSNRAKHDHLIMKFIPVKVPATFPSPTFLTEKSTNGNVTRFELLVIRLDVDGNIRMTPYNFTDFSKMKAGSYDLSKLDSLRPEDLNTEPRCEISFETIERDVYFGAWPDCRTEGPAYYHPLITCGFFSSYVTKETAELFSPKAYKLVKSSTKYPLLPYMLEDAGNFEDPCEC